MQIQISGQHISIGQSLKDYATDRTIEIVTKYFAEAPSGHIYFAKNNRHEFVCDIVVNEGTGRHVIVNSRATCDDIYSAFEQSIAKIQKQLRKYRSKLNDYKHKLKLSEVANDAVNYTISNKSATEDYESEANVDNPAIIAETPLQIPTISVGEAVMQMDLKDLPALMFRNVKNNRINVVYYRKDGNIAWLDHKDSTE